MNDKNNNRMPLKVRTKPLTSRSISVIVACYRDGVSIKEMYNRLVKYLPTVTSHYEIIYVNDASPDNAREILAELANLDPNLVVINHTRNFGSQNCFLSGMEIAGGEGVILMDGDLQDPPSLIPELVCKWLEGYDIVYGERIKRMEKPVMQVARKVFYRLFRYSSSFNIPVDAGDFGLMDRRVYRTLLQNFSESRVFLRGLRAFTGFRSVGVPYVRDARYDGVSTNNLMSNINWAKFAVFSFSKKPIEYIWHLSVSCLVICLLGGLLYFFIYGCYDHLHLSWGIVVLLTIGFMGSLQLVCLSIIAEYIGHIYDEVKKRPRYLVHDIIDNRKRIEKSSSHAISSRFEQEIKDE